MWLGQHWPFWVTAAVAAVLIALIGWERRHVTAGEELDREIGPPISDDPDEHLDPLRDRSGRHVSTARRSGTGWPALTRRRGS